MRDVDLLRALRGADVDQGPIGLAEHLLALILAAVPGGEAGALFLMDPQTGLFWSGAVDGLPLEMCHPYFEIELANESDSFRRMAASRSLAQTLGTRSDDALLMPELVRHHGFSDELRCVLTDGSVAWGAVAIYRTQGSFEEADRTLVDAISLEAGRALRRSVLLALDSDVPRAGAQGVVVIEDGAVTESRVDDPAMIRELERCDQLEYRHLDHLIALAERDPAFSTVLYTSDSGWLSAYGLELAPGRVAVVLTAATAADTLGARITGSGLTAREIEVTRLVCQGLSDAEIAARLWLSPHTVHDHVRAIRGKFGVRTRAAIASRIFSEAYLDGLLATAAVRHSGSE